MRNLVNLTDSQIEELFDEAFGADANMNPEFGEIKVAFTAETFADFDNSSKKYKECKFNHVYDEFAGYKTMVMRQVQVDHGDQRRDVCIVDFGDVRGVVWS